jgi:hypothetical protein
MKILIKEEVCQYRGEMYPFFRDKERNIFLNSLREAKL